MKKMNNRLCQSACLSVCWSNYFLGSGSEGDEEHGICLYIRLSIPPLLRNLSPLIQTLLNSPNLSKWPKSKQNHSNPNKMAQIQAKWPSS